jgi:TonB family protein
MALVLVVGQGLAAQEALAQVRRAAIRTPLQATAHHAQNKPAGTSPLTHENPNMVYGVVVENMPSFQGGGPMKVVAYIQQHVMWPHTKDGKMVQAEGRVFASFSVGTDGKVRDSKIVKGIHSLFDAEVLRVLRAMPSFKPGSQNGQPVAVQMTVPVTFKLK